MRTIIIGKTDSILTLNKVGIPIQGKTRAIVDIVTEEQEKEIAALSRAGLIEVVTEQPKNIIDSPVSETAKIKMAEEETQKEGARVIIATRTGAKEAVMKKSYVPEWTESDKTKESIDAMKKLEDEENEENEENKIVIEEENDPSEQKNRSAFVATEGETNKVEMRNSILPDSDAIRQIDPFIDREEKTEKEVTKEPIIKDETGKDEEDGFSDAFIIDL